MRAGEVVDALEVHCVVGELDVVDEVEGRVRDVGVQAAGLGGKAWDAVAALFGGAEFEGEDGLVACVYYAEVVGHFGGDGSCHGWEASTLLEAAQSQREKAPFRYPATISHVVVR